jgi:hypothetical protein
MRRWNHSARRWTWLACTVAASGLAISAAYGLGDIFVQPDAGYYLSLSGGGQAMLPFAWRQLGPLIVRGEVQLLHLPWFAAWYAEGVAALLFFVAGVTWLLIRSGAPRWMLPAALGICFWSLQFNALVLPDLLFAALLCGFLLLLGAGRNLAAALMLFPLMVARESAWLVLACMLIAGWRRLRGVEMAAGVGAAVAGSLLVRHLAANALPNQEHLSPWLYLLAKAPWNGLKNIFGVELWANVYPACAAPRWQFAVHAGALREVGICGFSAEGPVKTLGAALASFGLLPLLAVRMPKVPVPGLLLRFAVVYGGVSLLAAPLLGDSQLRLFAYGWPLLLVALPMLLGRSGANFRSRENVCAFLTLHLGLSWSVLWLNAAELLVAGVVVYALGWVVVQKTFQNRVVGEETATM